VAKKYRINMKGVEKEIRRGGGRVRIPEGEYPAKIISATLETSRRDETSKYFQWRVQITSGPQKGKQLRANTSLKREALFNLRNLINAAAGRNMAGKVFDFDPETLYGRTVGIVVSDNAWTDGQGNERITSQVDTFFPVSELATVSDDEEEDEVDEEDEDEETEDDDDELEEVDEDDL
jgi:hypothetical protein